MLKFNRCVSVTSATALLFVASGPTLVIPILGVQAMAYSPMPPACQAASNAVQAEGARYSQPPANAATVVQLQHALYLTGLLIDALDRSCQDWTDYASTRQQFQTTYDATVKTCLQVATTSSDCRRKPYGS